MPGVLNDVSVIIKDVEDFIKEHGRRPSRGTALGTMAHRKLKSTATSAEEKAALRAALGAAPIGSVSTISRLKVLKSKPVTGAAIADKDRRFFHNQAYNVKKNVVKKRPASFGPVANTPKRPASSSSSAPEPSHAWPLFRRGRPRQGEDLQHCSATIVGGIPLLHQAVVDWLHRALYDFQALMGKTSVVWFVSWGTLLGLHRDGGFIPYDVDVDVTLVVDSLEHFTWQVFPSLRSSLESAGYRVHRVPAQQGLLRGAKIAPAKSNCENLYTEFRARVAEESLEQGLRLDRAQINKRASARLSALQEGGQEAGLRNAIGCNTVDIELAIPSCTKTGYLDLVGHRGLHIKSPVETQRATFGGVPVFKPNGAAHILNAMYPGGFSKRMFKCPRTGKCKAVPASVPKHTAPSSEVAAPAQ